MYGIVKINYVIASYAGVKGAHYRNVLENSSPHPKDYIKVHLEQLSKISHGLAQITLCKAATGDADVYEDYYKFSDTLNLGCPLVEIDVPNEGISYGQYIRAYLKSGSKFDYYIFVEDDYIPVLNQFDQVLQKVFDRRFRKTNGIGVLCQWASYNDKHHLHGAHGLFIVSSKTLSRMIRMNQKPIQKLARASNGFAQVVFGILFNNCGIQTKDIVDLYYTPYFVTKTQDIIDCSPGKPKNNECVFVPIQMYQNYTSVDFSKIPKHPFHLNNDKQTLIRKKPNFRSKSSASIGFGRQTH